MQRPRISPHSIPNCGWKYRNLSRGVGLVDAWSEIRVVFCFFIAVFAHLWCVFIECVWVGGKPVCAENFKYSDTISCLFVSFFHANSSKLPLELSFWRLRLFCIVVSFFFFFLRPTFATSALLAKAGIQVWSFACYRYCLCWKYFGNKASFRSMWWPSVRTGLQVILVTLDLGAYC